VVSILQPDGSIGQWSGVTAWSSDDSIAAVAPYNTDLNAPRFESLQVNGDKFGKPSTRLQQLRPVSRVRFRVRLYLTRSFSLSRVSISFERTTLIVALKPIRIGFIVQVELCSDENKSQPAEVKTSDPHN